MLYWLHLWLMRFYRFLAPFSQFSRKFPGSCEERAVLSGTSGRFRDYSGRFGKLFKSLENRLPKRHGGSNPSSCAIKTNTIPRGWCLFLSRRMRGREPTSATFCCRMGFAYPTRRSKSSLFRCRVWVSSSKTNTTLPAPNKPLETIIFKGFYYTNFGREVILCTIAFSAMNICDSVDCRTACTNAWSVIYRRSVSRNISAFFALLSII